MQAKSLTISFIGFGNMAQALVKAWRNEPWQIRAASPSLTPDITEAGVITYSDNCQAIKDADLVILAVKPQQMATVLQEIQATLTPSTVVISLAAGLSLSWFASRINPDISLVRCMPNIAVAYNKGATPLIANEQTTDLQKDLVSRLFNQAGITTWLTHERDMDTFTALSGSGPAYVFLFLEALAKGAEHAGIDKQLAENFALQTLAGALSFIENTGLHPEEARHKVTSKQGTTAAALAVFEQAGFTDIISKAMQAASDRAKQLANNL